MTSARDIPEAERLLSAKPSRRTAQDNNWIYWPDSDRSHSM